MPQSNSDLADTSYLNVITLRVLDMRVPIAPDWRGQATDRGLLPKHNALAASCFDYPETRYFQSQSQTDMFHPAMKNFLQPYANSDLAGFPWLLILIPHGLLPIEWGNAVNFVIYLIVLMALIFKYKGGWFAIFTFMLTINAFRTNNVDWIAALFFLLPNRWTLPLLLAKPQILGGAALIWWKREKFRWQVLIPGIAVVALSFVIWGWWVGPMLQKSSVIVDTQWNYAVFPFGIPVGLYMLYCAYRQDDEVLAACATAFFVPYMATYSLALISPDCIAQSPRSTGCILHFVGAGNMGCETSGIRNPKRTLHGSYDNDFLCAA